MKKIIFAVAALTVAVASRVSAQTTCPTGAPTPATATLNARQQAADLFLFVAPQLGQSLAGGSATLGQNSNVGGLGHFSIGVHGTAVAGSVPVVTAFPTCYTGAYRAVLPTDKSVVPMAGADAAIGIFGGLPLALTNVGGVDLLVSAQYVPERTFSDVRLSTPDGSLKLGYGARIGILSESFVVPGVSLSYIKRDLPRVSIAANTSGGDTLSVNGLKLKSSSWRLSASKSLIILNLGAGVGQDKLESSLDSIHVNVGYPTSVTRNSASVIPTPQKLTRTNYFVNATFNLIIAKLTAEVGQSKGGTVDTFNSFDGAQASGTRSYGSVGVRFGF